MRRELTVSRPKEMVPTNLSVLIGQIMLGGVCENVCARLAGRASG